YTQRNDPKYVKHPNIYIGNLQRKHLLTDGQFLSPWYHRTADTGRKHGNRRSSNKQSLVCSGWNNLFLEEKFTPIGQGLQQTKGSCTIRTEPGLHKTCHLTLH